MARARRDRNGRKYHPILLNVESCFLPSTQKTLYLTLYFPVLSRGSLPSRSLTEGAAAGCRAAVAEAWNRMTAAAI